VVDDGQSVEVSFGGVRAEPLLEIALRRFGERIASMGAGGYRAPNDVWLHVDLGAEWPLQELLRNARSRLARGGSLVLVTGAAGAPPAVDGLARETVSRSRVIPGARIVWWRRGRATTPEPNGGGDR
jgi:hypothetical protein